MPQQYKTFIAFQPRHLFASVIIASPISSLEDNGILLLSNDIIGNVFAFQ